MAHINPQLPADGQQNWASTADNYLTTLTNQINLHDDQIQGLLTNGVGGAAPNVIDNGDNTITILPSGGSGGTGGGTPGSGFIAFDADGTPYVAIV